MRNTVLAGDNVQYVRLGDIYHNWRVSMRPRSLFYKQIGLLMQNNTCFVCLVHLRFVSAASNKAFFFPLVFIYREAKELHYGFKQRMVDSNPDLLRDIKFT